MGSAFSKIKLSTLKRRSTDSTPYPIFFLSRLASHIFLC